MLPSGAISRLYIANANRHDSGNYSCGKFNFKVSIKQLSNNLISFPFAALGDITQATVMVHVLIGKINFLSLNSKTMFNKFITF